jgi:hypothetical protein
MFKKAVKVAEGPFRKSHASRQTAAALGQGSAEVNASGTTESRENYAPASRNIVEVAKKLDDVFTAVGPSGELRYTTHKARSGDIRNILTPYRWRIPG